MLRGTNGDDVIVTNGALLTLGRGGNDLICGNGRLITISDEGTSIDAGAGNDTVDTTDAGRRADVFTHLGPGDDTYIGGPTGDIVWGAEVEDADQAQGTDNINTGPGEDHVATGGTGPGGADDDVINLGSGDDSLEFVGPTDATQTAQGGSGTNQIYLEEPMFAAPAVIDNITGTMTIDGTPAARWESFVRFELDAVQGYEPPQFVGSDEGEYLDARIVMDEVDLAGGNDTLELWPETIPELTDVVFDGGDGTDRFFFHRYESSGVILDLGSGAFIFGRDPSATPYARIFGIEKHDLAMNRIEVMGSSGPDRITWTACHGSISGWKGDDRVTWNDFTTSSGGDRHCGQRGEPLDVPVAGNAGDDVLSGGLHYDTLIGGAGDDTAIGRRGEDRCQAETEESCER